VIPATGVLTNASLPESFPWDGPTSYPDNASSARPVSLPGNFCTSATLPPSGALHIAAYANGSRTYANLSDADVYTGPFIINVTGASN
jgi:hypothetical protein